MKKFFAMLTVCALMLSLCGLPSVGAAENVPDENSIFFTDFDGYRYGTDAWTNLAFGAKGEDGSQNYMVDGQFMFILNGAMEPKQMENQGTSVFMGNDGDYNALAFGYWANGGLAVNSGQKYLISYDLLMGDANALHIFATEGTNIAVLFSGTGVSERNEFAPLKENVLELGKWTRFELYIDTANKKYAVYVGGRIIGEEQDLVFENSAEPQIGIMHFRNVPQSNGIYIDNVGISAPSVPPYAVNAVIPTGVAVGKTLDVTFSSGVNQETLDNIKITDSKGSRIAFTIAEMTANGVKLSFTEPLTAGECYSVDMSGVKGLLGQDVVCRNNKTEAYAGNNNLMFTNFDGYALGDGAWTNLAFGAKGEGGSQNYMVDGQFMFILNGAMEPKQMENHGTSAFMGANVEYNYMALGYWRDGGFAFNQGQKYLISYDLLMGDADALHIFATEGTNIAVLFSGTGVSERNEVAPLKENVLELGKWARVELYMDPGNKKYSVHVDGKLIGEEQSFEFNNPAAPEVGIINFRNVTQSNGIYIDNVGIASLDEMPIAKNEITLKEGENNTVIADYKATAEKAGVFIAAYDEGGILLNAAYKTDQTVDGKGYESTLSMNKVDGAKTYKAFLWNDSYQPLCPASNPLTVQ